MDSRPKAYAAIWQGQRDEIVAGVNFIILLAVSGEVKATGPFVMDTALAETIRGTIRDGRGNISLPLKEVPFTATAVPIDITTFITTKRKGVVKNVTILVIKGVFAVAVRVTAKDGDMSLT